MSEYLFAYGTIRSGKLPLDIARIVNGLHPIGTGAVQGRLYNFGDYPGIRLDDPAEHAVRGIVLELHSPREVFDALDRYESFDPTNPDDSLFRRVHCSVTTDSGEVIECWVYEYNRDPGGAALLAHGDYLLAGGSRGVSE